MRKRITFIVLALLAVTMIGATGRVLYYFEDDAHVSGDRGMIPMAVRNDSPIAALAGTTGDYSPLQVDDDGDLYTVDSAAATLLGTIDTDTGNIATYIGTTTDALVDAGATGSVSSKLRRATTDLDTINNELDGTTHGGKTLLYVEIDVDLTGGGDSAAIIAASNEIFIVELFIMVDAQCQLQFTDGSEGVSVKGIEFPLPAYGGVHLKRQTGYRFVLDDGDMMSLDDIDGGTVEVRGYVWFYQE